jgi:hypothetical protein
MNSNVLALLKLGQNWRVACQTSKMLATPPRRFAALICICTCALAVPPSAEAAVTTKDIQVAGRILGFTTTPLTGNVKMGIAYDPSNARSLADERALLGILGSGLQVGNVTLLPVPITISKITTTPADILFLTTGLGPEAAKVGAQAAAAKILCITTDLSATLAGHCAVSVQTAPSVEITINTATAAASGIDFESAFMLMITEI